MNTNEYIYQLDIENPYTQKNHQINLDKNKKLHLILTGKNGTGKTTTLNLIGENISYFSLHFALSKIKKIIHTTSTSQTTRIKHHHTNITYLIKKITSIKYIKISAKRNFSFQKVSGPTKDIVLDSGSKLHQILVNYRTQIAYARESNNTTKIQELSEYIEKIERSFAHIFEIEDLRLAFDPDNIEYTFQHKHGKFGFHDLPDGFASILGIWSEIQSVVEVSQKEKEDFIGFVLIDEIETHLHISLQRKIMPFLTEFFPQFQFIVTTHSPAVLSSIEDAVIYDLSSDQRILSKDLVGLRYGEILTDSLGVASDFDIHTYQDLNELKALHQNPHRTQEETARMRDLARHLSQRSHVLAIQIWQELEFGEE